MSKEEDFTDYDTENDRLDSDVGSDLESKTDKAAKNGEPILVEELLRTKRPRNVKLFTDDLLASKDGIQRIYSEFPKTCKYESRGSEAAYLRRVLTRYKEWAFQLHPGIAFEDIVLKCEALGSKGRVRACLSDLRNAERERFLESSIPDWNKKRRRTSTLGDATQPLKSVTNSPPTVARQQLEDEELWQEIPNEAIQIVFDDHEPVLPDLEEVVKQSSSLSP